MQRNLPPEQPDVNFPLCAIAAIGFPLGSLAAVYHAFAAVGRGWYGLAAIMLAMALIVAIPGVAGLWGLREIFRFERALRQWHRGHET